MIFFIAAGLLSLSIGFLFIFFPGAIMALNDAGKRMVTNVDAAAFSHRGGLGLTLIIASLLFFFVAYYISVRG
jgi:TRAP-type C4-dicarboxylate transport system permease large subunit